MNTPLQKYNNLLHNTIARTGGVKDFGAFSNLFDPKKYDFEDPVFLTTTDGVGSKLQFMQKHFPEDYHKTIASDLYAMNANDLLVRGAKPLIFMDYISGHSLETQANDFSHILHYLNEICMSSQQCSLVGGETAEMPSLYKKGDFDIAGFAIGGVERSKLLPKNNLEKGDYIVGLESWGVHSNGYSAIRKIYSDRKIRKDIWLAQQLSAPTRNYEGDILRLLDQDPDAIRGMAHITGGGILENVPRISNQRGIVYDIDMPSFPVLFKKIMKDGKLSEQEMLDTFNCGIGMVLVVRQQDIDEVMTILEYSLAHIIGRVRTSASGTAFSKMVLR